MFYNNWSHTCAAFFKIIHTGRLEKYFVVLQLLNLYGIIKQTGMYRNYFNISKHSWKSLTMRQQMTSFSSQVSPKFSVTQLVVFLPLQEYPQENSSSPKQREKNKEMHPSEAATGNQHIMLCKKKKKKISRGQCLAKTVALDLKCLLLGVNLLLHL